MDVSRAERIEARTVSVSCIVPVFNEEANIEPFLVRLNETLFGLTDRYEILIVDDGSTDQTALKVLAHAASLPVRYIGFSRNFGKEMALTAGLEHCSGDVAILMDADFQHPLVIYLVIVAGLLPAAAIGTFLHPHYHHQLWPWLTLAAVSLSTMGLLLLWLCFRGGKLANGLYVLASSAVAFCLIFLGSATMINQDSLKPLALTLKQDLQPEDEVVTFYRYYQDLPIYLERRITIVTDWQATDIPLRDNWVREIWYGMPFQKTDDWLINEKTFWERWNSPRKLTVLLDRKRLGEFIQKSAGTIHAMGEYEDVAWVKNY